MFIFIHFAYFLLFIFILYLDYPKATYPEFVTYVQTFLADVNTENREKNEKNIVTVRTNTGAVSTGFSMNVSTGVSTSARPNVVSTDKGVSNMFVLKGGHLFDRLMSVHILSGDYQNENNGQTGSNSGSGSVSGGSGIGGNSEMMKNNQNTGIEVEKDVEKEVEISLANAKISVTYMLVALNMAVRTAAEERVDALFYTAQILSKIDLNKNISHGEISFSVNNENGNDNAVDRSTTVNIGSQVVRENNEMSGKEVGIDGGNEGEVEEEYVSITATEEIVRDLYSTWQVSGWEK